MPHPGRVGVCQFVDQDQLGLASECQVEIEFLELASAVLDFTARKQLEPQHELSGFATLVVLDESHDHVALLIAHQVASDLQHAVGLAHPWREPEEDLELPAPRLKFLLLHPFQQCIRIGSVGWFTHASKGPFTTTVWPRTGATRQAPG